MITTFQIKSFTICDTTPVFTWFQIDNKIPIIAHPDTDHTAASNIVYKPSQPHFPLTGC